jgi:hypothetical protein
VPFRAYGGPDPLSGPKKSGRARTATWFKALAGIAVVVALILGARYFGINPASVPATVAGSPTPAAANGPKNNPPAGYEESGQPLGSAPTVPAASSGGFRFMATQTDETTPVAWSPCRPIHYVVRPDNAPKGGDAVLTSSFAQVSAATGLVFINDGSTTEAPSEQRDPYLPDRYGDRWAPVLVAWATPNEVPDFGVDIAGEAGATRVSTPTGGSTYISGILYLDPAKFRQIRSDFGPAIAATIVIHELGHLVGLAHVNDPTQIMWPRGNSLGLTGYQPGDLAGLAALGRGACQPDV